MPTDPTALGAQLQDVVRAGSGPDKGAADVARDEFQHIGDLLTMGGFLSHDLSRALQAVLASLPGVQITHQAHNLDGDTGTEYTLVNHVAHGRQDRRRPHYPDGSHLRLLRRVHRNRLPGGPGDRPERLNPQAGGTTYAAGTAQRAGGTPTLNN